MTISKQAKKTSKQESSTLKVIDDKNKSEQRKLAEVKLSPTILNTVAAQSFVKPIIGDVDLTEAIAVMSEKSEKIIAGDLSDLESTLATQIVSLNAIYTSLSKRSMACEYISQMETNLRLALKAQAQCARTAEILATIKNPPIVYAKQANIAQGHQQINNGDQSATHTRKTKNSANELLSEDNHAPLDTRGTIETGRIDQELATVEAIDGR